MPDKFCSVCKLPLVLKDNLWLCPNHGKVPFENPFISKRLFISYGHDEHVSLADRINRDLLARGHQTWFDKDRLKAGNYWEIKIEEGLDWLTVDKQNSAIILLLTPHSVRRPDGYCLNEIARALSRGINIIPLMVVDSEPPLSICRIQWLDMRECIPINEKEFFYLPRFERLLAAIEENRLDFDGIQQRLIKVLQPLEFDAEINSHFPKFIGRQWVFDKINEWLRNGSPEERIFWIIGTPGIGKTAVSAILSAHFREIAAMHLCKFGHAYKGDPRRVVTSLAYQLSTQLPEYESQLARMRDLEELVKSDASTIFDSLLVQPLTKINPPDRLFIILIDALDEAIVDTRNKYNILASFIATQFPKTPNWVRLIITSRPESEVMAPLQGITPYILEKEIKHNSNDIRNYLHRELANLLMGRSDIEIIINRIIKKSEGIFLYIEHICNDLIKGSLSLDNLEKFPRGLGEVFLHFFDRLVWVDSNNPFPDYERYRREYRPALRAILSAYAPLPITLLQHILKKQSDEILDFIRSLGSMFPVSNENGINFIKPYHKLIFEWLTDEKSAGEYFISIDEGHFILTDALWTEFSNHPKKKMSEYCYHFLPLHLKDTERWDDLLEVINSPYMRLIKRWIEEGEGDVGIECLEGVCKYMVQNGKDPGILAALASQLAQLYSLRADYLRSEFWLKQSLKNSSFFRGRRIRAIAFHELGSLSLYKHDYKSSSRYFHRALRLCTLGLKQYHDEAASNLIGMATVAKEKDDHLKILSIASRAIKKAIKGKDINRIVEGERLKGIAYKSLGDFDKAKEHLMISLTMSELIKSRRERYRTLLVLGYLEYNISILNNTPTHIASQLFEEALDGAKYLNDFFHYIEAMLSIGWLKLIENRRNVAEQFFTEVKEKLKIDEHPELMSVLLLGFSAVDHSHGETENAKKAYQNVIDFCKLYQLNSSLYRALIGLGSINYHENKSADAEKLWSKAIKIAGGISRNKLDLAKASIEICKKDSFAIPR